MCLVVTFPTWKSIIKAQTRNTYSSLSGDIPENVYVQLTAVQALPLPWGRSILSLWKNAVPVDVKTKSRATCFLYPLKHETNACHSNRIVRSPFGGKRCIVNRLPLPPCCTNGHCAAHMEKPTAATLAGAGDGDLKTAALKIVFAKHDADGSGKTRTAIKPIVKMVILGITSTLCFCNDNEATAEWDPNWYSRLQGHIVCSHTLRPPCIDPEFFFLLFMSLLLLVVVVLLQLFHLHQ